MRGASTVLLLTAAVPAMIDAPQFARGAAAVGDRPSAAIALRQAQTPSPSFRLGAAYRAWRNAGAAVAHDASHPTGDGGDEEVLAEDCSDERIAFEALEAERGGLGLTVDRIGAAVVADPGGVAAWRARQAGAAAQCRRR